MTDWTLEQMAMFDAAYEQHTAGLKNERDRANRSLVEKRSAMYVDMTDETAVKALIDALEEVMNKYHLLSELDNLRIVNLSNMNRVLMRARE